MFVCHSELEEFEVAAGRKKVKITIKSQNLVKKLFYLFLGDQNLVQKYFIYFWVNNFFIKKNKKNHPPNVTKLHFFSFQVIFFVRIQNLDHIPLYNNFATHSFISILSFLKKKFLYFLQNMFRMS